MTNPADRMSPVSGKAYDSEGNVVWTAEKLNALYNALVENKNAGMESDIKKVGGALQSGVDLAAKINELHQALVVDKNAGVALTGRNLAVESGDFTTESLSVAPAGTHTVTISPSAGELWRIKLIRFTISAPLSAGSGTHSIAIVVDSTSYGIFAIATAPYNKSCGFSRNVLLADNTGSPSTNPEIQHNIASLICSADNPLKILYTNNTNAIQTFPIQIFMVWEVEYIV